LPTSQDVCFVSPYEGKVDVKHPVR
jgi:hypothetical protein